MKYRVCCWVVRSRYSVPLVGCVDPSDRMNKCACASIWQRPSTWSCRPQIYLQPRGYLCHASLVGRSNAQLSRPPPYVLCQGTCRVRDKRRPRLFYIERLRTSCTFITRVHAEHTNQITLRQWSMEANQLALIIF